MNDIGNLALGDKVGLPTTEVSLKRVKLTGTGGWTGDEMNGEERNLWTITTAEDEFE